MPEPTMSIAPATLIGRTTLAGAAFEQLISSVVHGKWKAGQRLPPERELCQQLASLAPHCARHSKRWNWLVCWKAALAKGRSSAHARNFYLAHYCGRLPGTDHAELADLMEARVFMERDLAGLAAERATPEELAHIEGNDRNDGRKDSTRRIRSRCRYGISFGCSSSCSQ